MENKIQIEVKPPSNAFSRVMQDFRGGASLDELAEGLEKLVAAVKETGRGGALTYKVTVKPASKGIGFSVLVSDDITLKLPKTERDSGIFFATDDNRLVRDNPAQKTLDLKVVNKAEPAPLKQVNG